MTSARTSATADAYRCARGPWCAGAEVDEAGRRHGAGIGLVDSLCGGCVVALTRALELLPRDYAALELLLDVQNRAAERVSGSPEPPAPPRLDVLDAQTGIDVAVSCWAEPVAERLGVDWDTTAMARRRAGVRVQRAAGLLASAVDVLLRLGPVDVLAWGAYGLTGTTRTGVEAGLVLLDVHRRASLLACGGPGDVRLPVPCPSCEGLLIRRNGMSHVACQSCPRTWPEADYAQLCRVLAVDFQAVTR